MQIERLEGALRIVGVRFCLPSGFWRSDSVLPRIVMNFACSIIYMHLESGSSLRLMLVCRERAPMRKTVMRAMQYARY